MKKNLILMIAPVALLLVMLSFGYKLTAAPESRGAEATIVQVNEKIAAPTIAEDKWVKMEKTTRSSGDDNTSETQEIIDYAITLLGSPYEYAGITPSGFDCSGFVTHVFDNYNIDVPHSSALQANEGVPVAKEDAAPGDLVLFTGTNENIRKPGHVGIVISEPGDTISFVHSSSNGGVKISKVQGTRYDIRFLEVRRIL